MNILLINHYSGNNKLGMAFRPYYMAREWIKQGHQVTIVGASFSHLRTTQPLVMSEYKIEFINGIKYIWIKTPQYKSPFERVLNISTFVFKLSYFQGLIRRESKPDVVIASSTYPLDIFSASKIAKKSKAKLCFEVHDLWPLSPRVIGDYSKWHPFIIVMQLAENYAYKKSDVVISFLDKALPYMQKHGLKPDKFKIIPNGYCATDWEEIHDSIPAEHEILLTHLKEEGNIIIGYAGGHAPSNALEILVAAAKIFKERNNLAFVLVGDGPIKENIIQSAKLKKLTNVYFLPAVSKRSIPDLISRFDITYMGGVKSMLHKYGTSFNKMTDYLLSAKPIIFSVDEPDTLIDKIHCGITVPAEDPEAVAGAIERITTLTASERLEMGLRGKRYAEKELEYSILSKRMLDYIAYPQN